jgi:hypothetical protein
VFPFCDQYTHRQQKLQDTAFTFFKQDHDNQLLHFHLDSHGRCDVELKPLLWNQGTSFEPGLLIDGALRNIPHFVPIAFWEGATLERPLSPVPFKDAAVLSPVP